MFLQLPPLLKRPSDNEASTEIEVACDWLEASVLFSGVPASKPEAADLLKDEYILPDAATATRFLDDVWRQLRSREIQQGPSGPFTFDYQRMRRSVSGWEDAPAHAFCLLLSHPLEAPRVTKKNAKVGIDYTVQGELFERLVEAACKALWPSWTVRRTGWSKNQPQQIRKVVEDVARCLCGKVGNINRWATPGSKERGLDILWFREFPDRRGCFPAFLMQCASGKLFERKLDTPNQGIWSDLLELVPRSLPRKAFASPLAFGTKEFERHSIHGNCLLLDRMRLFAAAESDRNWVPRDLHKDLVKWIGPRVGRLQWRN